jgi:hypothetical protein
MVVLEAMVSIARSMSEFGQFSNGVAKRFVRTP